ncbi:site-specific DNA-methyltransferase [Halioglobus sp. Uisw_031]|uniref:site-specific DNA-methyltransferase n=1 Tax=Halioglobus sp. Uisw_031 TaxID=3230977 RepID=UPI0039E7859F
MEKLKMHSPDITQQNIDKLLELFPNCKTEKQDANGELINGVDFDLLKQELSKNIVEGPQERYQLNWPGKKEALLTANAPIAKTLRPCREESVDFDTTENLFIEGDNLDALKLLQETYLGKVKMIYIDPPYNTGKDFIYADNFSESTDEYLQESGQKDEQGNRLVANTESNGRFHSDWLSMLYSRLKLARNLLQDEGVIFISIDDGEHANLKRMCDEVFGEGNFIANICWQKFHSVKSNASHNVSQSHDFILCYGKVAEEIVLKKLPMSEEALKVYKNPDNDPRGDWRTAPLTVSLLTGSRGASYKKTGKSTGLYEITSPNGGKYYPSSGRCWIAKDSVERLRNDNRIWWGKDGSAVPMQKIFLAEKGGVKTISTFWDHNNFGSNKKANEELKDLFSDNDDETENFPTPKPTKLIKTLIDIADDKNGIVLDFFAGSATTAASVMALNSEDGGKRKFIMVQLPEEISSGKYKNISDIGKERIRRASKKINEENPESTSLDTGFRVIKIDSSNMNEVHYTPDSVAKGDLLDQIDHIKNDRSSEDLLFQIMLDWGVDLSLPIHKKAIEGKEVYFVNDDDLVACFDKDIDEALIKALAAKKPLRVVFRDDGFVSDSVKINIEQIFKQLAPATDIKAI